MRTTNCKKIHLAEELLTILENIKQLKIREEELKTQFKNTFRVGLLEAGNVIILIEKLKRSSIDRDLLEARYGIDKVKRFEKITEYLQVNVKRKVGT